MLEQSKLKQYFPDFWTTENKAKRNKGAYAMYEKLRIETELEWEDLKDRITTWLRQNKFYLRKPYIWTEKVVKIRFFLDSSTAQWHQGVQAVVEKTIFDSTKTHVPTDIQNRAEKFQDDKGKQDQTPTLTVQVPEELNEVETEGLLSKFTNRVTSPVGRRMSSIPTRDISERSRAKLNKILTRQKILNVRERQTSTDFLRNILDKSTQ